MNLKITGLKVDATGEGSRGGHIIGHTASGKPIYGTHKLEREERQFLVATHKSKSKQAFTHHKLPPGSVMAGASEVHEGSTLKTLTQKGLMKDIPNPPASPRDQLSTHELTESGKALAKRYKRVEKHLN